MSTSPWKQAFVGTCDVCEKADVPVAAWADEHDSYTACEPCYVALEEAWNALSPDEQVEALRV